MVVIRLSRGGSNKSPFYHIVAADRRFARDGRYLERLGRFNPLARGQEKRLEIVSERVDHWVKMGAQASDRVKFLLSEFTRTDVVAAPRKSELKKAQQEAAQKAAFAAKQKAEAEAKAAAKAEAAEEAEKPAE